MEVSLSLIRMFFVLLSVLFATVIVSENFTELTEVAGIGIGVVSGICFASLLICMDLYLKRFSLRSLNIISLGLLLGCLLGYSILGIFNAFITISGVPWSDSILSAIKTAILLFGAYFGMVFTSRASEQLSISIPFMRFKAFNEKKKDVIVDPSVLYDTRIIDLAASGLLDHHLVLPRFVLREIQNNLEDGDDGTKSRARRSLDVLKRLEDLDQLTIRYADTDFPEIKDPSTKIIRLARLLGANVITTDISRVQQSSIESVEGIRIINIHTLSNALKPVTHTGEHLHIKIQRYGKESRQGVGYLEDGTMVVVNGGADFLGETIKAQVLSVKHTSSGRMIFCNAVDEDYPDDPIHVGGPSGIENHKDYFSI